MWVVLYMTFHLAICKHAMRSLFLFSLGFLGYELQLRILDALEMGK